MKLGRYKKGVNSCIKWDDLIPKWVWTIHWSKEKLTSFRFLSNRWAKLFSFGGYDFSDRVKGFVGYFLLLTGTFNRCKWKTEPLRLLGCIQDVRRQLHFSHQNRRELISFSSESLRAPIDFRIIECTNWKPCAASTGNLFLNYMSLLIKVNIRREWKVN